MSKLEVLTVGITLEGEATLQPDIRRELSRPSDYYNVTQLWYEEEKPYQPKFTLVNAMLATEDLRKYDYIFILDDDMELPKNFVDNYLHVVRKYDLALAQPARTSDSVIHHMIVEQDATLEARITKFVEIGPVVSFARQIVPLLTPFNTKISPMGWGFDYVWPLIVNKAGYRCGIVDSTPVRHNFRPPCQNYSNAGDQMCDYLNRTEHYDPKEAYTTLMVFPL